MKFKTLFTMAAISSAIFAASSQAATPGSLPAQNTAGATGATFAGGATINGGASFLSSIPADNTVSLIGTINPDPADVGKEADIFVGAKIGNSFFQFDGSAFTPWAVDLKSTTLGLVPSDTKTLAASEAISVPDLEGAFGQELDGDGLVKIYMAYAPTGESDLTYSSKGVKFTVSNPPAESCPAGTTFQATQVLGANDLCVLSGNYTDDLHLTANFDYIISGAVKIGDDNQFDTILTIDPGVTTYGQSGNDFLWIDRGAQIWANGTAENPITMTSANDLTATETTRGEWGGLVINGNAPINGCAEGTELCEAAGEGNSGLFGGNDPADSSGSLTYIRVKYAGFLINDLDELNGIAFQGTGSGTNVDYVQVHNNQDDGIEFFGGTTNAKHLYLTGNRDDSLDWTKGWTGKVQHLVIVQGTDTGDQGMEMDNNGDAPDSLPRAQPIISNATLIGNANTDIGMLIREGTGGNFYNFVVTGFGDGCIDIDTPETFSAAGSSATDLSGVLTMGSSVVDCDTNFIEESGDAFMVGDWFLEQTGNMEMTTGMTTYTNSTSVDGLTGMDVSTMDSFFDATDHVGAVPGDNDWISGWTFIP